jgi:biopolymer transport protein ExbD
MVPLMDSMFLLLVFFIYAMLAMVVHQGIPVKLPEALTATVSQKPYTAISVTASGDILVNKRTMTLAELVNYLSTQRQKGAEPDIYLNADVQAEYGWIVAILDALREQQFYNISFETTGGDSGE